MHKTKIEICHDLLRDLEAASPGHENQITIIFEQIVRFSLNFVCISSLIPKKDRDSLANNNQAFTETNRPLTMADFGDIHTISPK